jgi:putative sterol carrier protein
MFICFKKSGPFVSTQLEELEKRIGVLAERFKDPEVAKSLKGFTKTILFEFPDMGVAYTFYVEDGVLKSFERKAAERADIRVSMSSSVFIDIIDRKTNPIKEYQLGRINVKGSMSDLLKMRKLLF